MSSSAEKLQALYYTKTASVYDSMHTECKSDEHYSALRFIQTVCEIQGLKKLLDVGSGTGRSVGFLLAQGRKVRGIEPVRAMIEEAERRGIPSGVIMEGSGYSLPFEDNSFDAVLECGVLHHVAEPSRVVAEMIRVARGAVFLSDDNRFGHGHLVIRIMKLLLYKAHLWKAAMFLQTKGKMYKLSDGDGVAYSYSVFDSFNQLHQWADNIWLVPIAGKKPEKNWLYPLLTSSHVLLCALKDHTRPPEA